MSASAVVNLLIALAFLITLAHGCGRIARFLGQPAVIGEICCGVLLAPTLPFKPVSDVLLPAQVSPIINGVAQMGLAVFLYGIGTELAPMLRLRVGRQLGVSTLGSFAVPFLAGLGLAFLLAGTQSADHRFAFIVFFAAAMSVTAFPVLARLLEERKMVSTPEGNTALTAAAGTDVLCWLMLGPVIASVRLGQQNGQLWLLTLVVPYAVIMFAVIRPLAQRFPDAMGSPAVVLGVVCASAAATEWIGLHFSIGAFLAGVALAPTKNTPNKRGSENRIHSIGVVLVPLYFVLAGQQVAVSSLDGQLIVETAVIIVVAIASKFGGSYIGARSAQASNRAALTFATLMNTRGLTEIVFLTIGLQQGVIDSRLFTAMVIMTLVTTAMTGPVLDRLRRYVKDSPAQIVDVIRTPADSINRD